MTLVFRGGARLVLWRFRDHGAEWLPGRRLHSGIPPRTQFTLSSRPRRLKDRASGRRSSGFEGHVQPGLRAVAERCFARASVSAGQSGSLSSRDSVEGVEVLPVGVRQRVKVLLGRLDLVVTHPVHY
jgi:hypothetical protein